MSKRQKISNREKKRRAEQSNQGSVPWLTIVRNLEANQHQFKWNHTSAWLNESHFIVVK